MRSTLEVSLASPVGGGARRSWEQDEGFPGAATYETNETSETSETSETNRTRFKKPTSERGVLPPLFNRERYGKASVSSIVRRQSWIKQRRSFGFAFGAPFGLVFGPLSALGITVTYALRFSPAYDYRVQARPRFSWHVVIASITRG